VTVRPPALSNPRRIELSTLRPVPWPAYGVTCEGQIYMVELGQNEDAILTFNGSAPLEYPLWVVGGRNVRMIGLEMKLKVQPGCEPGRVTMYGGPANSNIHPALPGGMAVRLEQYGTSFVEGALIDVTGHDADCFVLRNGTGQTARAAREVRDFVIQNTLCKGVEGLGASDIGDGIHGDFLQNQGDEDAFRSVTLENITYRTSFEGIVLEKRAGYNGARQLTIRRYDHGVDTRYISDDKYDHQLHLALMVEGVDSWTIEDFYISDPRAGWAQGLVNNSYYGENATAHSGFKKGTPPGGPFAPESKVGRNYVSPHSMP
jgi:hypothetical protein